jgi:cbb3-type cytochrome oxidase maturation protein
MTLYYVPWILLIIASLWVSLAGFLWALKNGQFSEQDRARYLPLRDEIRGQEKGISPPSRAPYALLVVLVMGGLSITAVLFILINQPGGK